MSDSLADEPDYDVEMPRTDVAEDLRQVMKTAFEKSTDGRIYDAENERIRIRWLKAYVNAAKEYRQLVGDIESREQEERLERLEDLVDELA